MRPGDVSGRVNYLIWIEGSKFIAPRASCRPRTSSNPPVGGDVAFRTRNRGGAERDRSDRARSSDSRAISQGCTMTSIAANHLTMTKARSTGRGRGESRPIFPSKKRPSRGQGNNSAMGRRLLCFHCTCRLAAPRRTRCTHRGQSLVFLGIIGEVAGDQSVELRAHFRDDLLPFRCFARHGNADAIGSSGWLIDRGRGRRMQP